MASISESWKSTTDSNAAIRFIDVNLRGSGQVMFQNNPVTGLLFIVGIGWGAYVANMPAVAIGAVLGLLVSTITAYLLHVDNDSLRSGLMGYNGILVGAALPTFLTVDLLLWIYIVIGAAVSTVAFLAVANVFKTWGVAALTFPFVLVTWFLVLAAYAFNGVPIASMGPPAIPQDIAATAAAVPAGTRFWVDGFLKGLAQVFLIGNGVTGVIFLIALAASSIWAALFAMLGAAVAVLVAVAFRCGFGEHPGRSLWLQSSSDGDRPGLHLLQAVVARLPLCAPGHHIHGVRTSRDGRSIDARWYPDLHGAVYLRHMDFPAAKGKTGPSAAQAGGSYRCWREGRCGRGLIKPATTL